MPVFSCLFSLFFSTFLYFPSFLNFLSYVSSFCLLYNFHFSLLFINISSLFFLYKFLSFSSTHSFILISVHFLLIIYIYLLLLIPVSFIYSCFSSLFSSFNLLSHLKSTAFPYLFSRSFYPLLSLQLSIRKSTAIPYLLCPSLPSLSSPSFIMLSLPSLRLSFPMSS